jgi:large subunit ribosomal protein L19e
VNLRNQRRMAAEILGVGETRVWVDPDRTGDLEDAITRADIRSAIKEGVIRKKPPTGVSRGRARHRAAQRRKGRRRGPGSRKGAANARSPRKRRWIRTIRPQRRRLRELRKEGRIDAATYRRFYRQAKGGMFRSRAHMEQQLRSAGAVEEES